MHGQVMVVGQNREANEEIAAAIDFAISGSETSNRIAQSAINFEDHTRTSWICHRSASGQKWYRNGVEVERNSPTVTPSLCLRRYEIAAASDGVVIRGREKYQNFDNTLSELIGVISGELATEFNVQTLTEAHLSVIDKDLRHTWQTRVLAEDLLSKVNSTQEEPNSHWSEKILQIRNQLDLIHLVRANLLKVEATSLEGGNVKGELELIDAGILDLSARLNLPETAFWRKDGWRKVLKSLTQLMIQRQVKTTSEEMFRKNFDPMVELIEGWYEQVDDTLLRHQSTTAAHLLNSDQGDNHRLSGPNSANPELQTSDSIFRTRTSGQKRPNTPTPNPFQAEPKGFAGLEIVLARMTSQIRILRQQFSSDLEDYLQWNETQAQNLESCEIEWGNIAASHGFPDSFDLGRFLEFIEGFGEIINLEQRKEEILAAEKTKKELLSELRQLVIRWRSAANIHSSGPLGTDDLVLAEAHEIGACYDKTIRQLRALESTNSSHAVSTQLREWLAKQVAECDRQLQIITDELEISLPFDNGIRVERCLELAGQMRCLSKIATPSTQQNRHDSQVFNTLSIFKWNSVITEVSLLKKAAEAISAAENELAIILMSDCSPHVLMASGLNHLVYHSEILLDQESNSSDAQPAPRSFVLNSEKKSTLSQKKS